jgi:predicted transcriptional regulator
MKSERPTDTLVPPGLLAELQAVADEEHRTTGELVREAVQSYLEERRAQRQAVPEAGKAHTPAEAAARILSFARAICCLPA